MNHDCSMAVPLRTHQADWIFLNYQYWMWEICWYGSLSTRKGKESPSSQMSVLSEWVGSGEGVEVLRQGLDLVSDPKLPGISPLSWLKALKKIPSVCVCVSNTSLCSLKWHFLLMAIKSGEFLEPLVVIKNSAVKYVFVLIWFSDTRWCFPFAFCRKSSIPRNSLFL